MDEHTADASLSDVLNDIVRRLSSEDDVDLWRAVPAETLRDAAYLCKNAKTKSPVYVLIGACSHWKRPHQHRWLADGSFAAPYGYGGTGFAMHGLPELDWSSIIRWQHDPGNWESATTIRGKRPLTLRISVPTRTTSHDQAAIHTIWLPGSPTSPRAKLLRLYGFRKAASGWHCTASDGRDAAFELPLTELSRRRPSSRKRDNPYEGGNW